MADGKTPLMQGEETGPTAPPPAYDDAVSSPPPPLPPSNMAPQQNQYGAQHTQPGSTVYYGTIPQSSQTVILSRPPTNAAYPVHMQCTNCGQQIITNLTYVTGMTTWLACIAICAFGGFLGCCLIPFCLDGLKDVRHTCPGCGAHLGTFRKI
ncbi:lipopolysaccharide-induced tumor necrosis factor-alpha factor-like [Branchiostoma floridae]|uniref:Lipopolysaccharide-induced tumor necrosis factor-alpha factor-like n=1 Tax=Branchiostoma floridae TaxID=7739 RepID=A0A9J7HTV9_BRAFL|nr:lipopolysaccharide-induced tumor necrosis factor-alpha factor-like [Branchiostoma floridae]